MTDRLKRLVSAATFGSTSGARRAVRAVTLWVLGFLVAWLIGRAVFPSGLPFGVVLYGVVLGALSSLTAIGLILIYRSARIINFAQADIGGLAACGRRRDGGR